MTMQLPDYFTDFLAAIELPAEQREAAKNAHTELRGRLMADPGLKEIVVTTFLQGSYRRHTVIEPAGSARADVDVVVVTNLDRHAVKPEQALGRFKPFLREHYPDQWGTQGRSLGIEPASWPVDLDLVVTSAPAEVDAARLRRDGLEQAYPVDTETGAPAWKLSPLWIPDREAKAWQQAHPVEQLDWTHRKNAACNGHYVRVVKALKWWKRMHRSMPGHPKSYPLEHLIGAFCPDGITSIAEGVTRSLERMVSGCKDIAAQGQIPFLSNHGVPLQNVFARVPPGDFATFLRLAGDAAQVARTALEESDVAASARRWRSLFGDRFPAASEEGGASARGGFSPRTAPTVIGGGRFGR